jgi:hypothetical protein
MLCKEEINKKIEDTLKYTINQNPENSYIVMQCLELILELYDICEINNIVESIFRFDILQNPSAALLKLKTIDIYLNIKEVDNGNM